MLPESRTNDPAEASGKPSENTNWENVVTVEEVSAQESDCPDSTVDEEHENESEAGVEITVAAKEAMAEPLKESVTKHEPVWEAEPVNVKEKPVEGVAGVIAENEPPHPLAERLEPST
jgi:hypothetical protein